jgi:hypothetical protein
MAGTKLLKPTIGDLVLSFLLPGWGLIVGVIALVKTEWKRGAIMIAISFTLLLIIFSLRL